MSIYLRCNRCFAPLKSKERPCEFCGYNLMEEARKAEINATKKRIRDNLKKRPLPDGVSLDEKIRRLRIVKGSNEF